MALDTIERLPYRIKRAARSAERTLDVMKLQRSIHWDSSFTRTEMVEYARQGTLVCNLRGAALTVVRYLVKEGFDVSLRVDHQGDSGQGRAWDELHVHIVW